MDKKQAVFLKQEDLQRLKDAFDREQARIEYRMRQAEEQRKREERQRERERQRQERESNNSLLKGPTGSSETKSSHSSKIGSSRYKPY